MSHLIPPPVQVAPGVFLDVFYDRPSACWYGGYLDAAEIQIGTSWHGHTRDYVLIHRPPTPVKES